MRNDELSVQSMDFAVQIINFVKDLKSKHETVISNQIGRSGTSIGANIREAQYAHGKPDFIAKLQIALKEANETGYIGSNFFIKPIISTSRRIKPSTPPAPRSA